MKNKISLPIHSIVLLFSHSDEEVHSWANQFTHKIKNLDENLGVSSLLSKEEVISFHEKIHFPHANEFIIINGKNLSLEDRLDLMKIAKDNCYQVGAFVLDINKEEILSKLVDEERNIAARNINFFNKNVLQNISKKNFDFFYQTKSFDSLLLNQIEFKNYELWKNCQLSMTNEVVFIGDIHEHVDALADMRKVLPKNTQVVLLGDYLDKGEQTEQIIGVIEEMVRDGAKIVMANHESYVGRRLKGEITKTDLEAKLFSSLKVLQEDEGLAKRFLAIYDQSLPFVHYKNKDIRAYATHAPCENRFIGKLTDAAKKAQRNFFFKVRDDAVAMAEELLFVEKESHSSHPLHVFGHVAHQFENLKVNNKVWLDTGAVYGNKLTALHLTPEGNQKFIDVTTSKLAEGDLFEFPQSVKASVYKPKKI